MYTINVSFTFVYFFFRRVECISMAYHHKPGNIKKKERDERQRRKEEELEKIPKLHTFFSAKGDKSSVVSETAASTSTASNVDQQEQEESKPEILQRDEQVHDVMECDQQQEDDPPLGDLYSNDLGLWPVDSVSESLRDFFSTKGSAECQHVDSDFSNSEQADGHWKRFFNRSYFERHHSNGEKVHRSWLCYSPATSRVYCFPCKLFSAKETPFSKDGYSDWKNATARFSRHENSTSHLDAVFARSKRAQSKGRIDTLVAEEYKTQCKYGESVLQRVVAVIKFLAERGLAFRGHDEIIGSAHNGNYLGTLELLAQFDPFLATHIEKYGAKGRGSVSYLSSTICHELIDIMGKKVLNCIIDELKQAKYYSVSIDSTPDVSHIDRLTCIFRYVLDDVPVERFVKFLDMEGHTAKELSKSLLGFLSESGIAIENCRGQSYDNASNMSGRYMGLQAVIRERNPLAEWIPCFGHSLNLVGQSAVNCVPSATAFFDFITRLYTFFSASTHRWNILLQELQGTGLPVVKRLSTTRWSAHSDATTALKLSFNKIHTALTRISEDMDEDPTTRSDASGIVKKMNRLENGILLELWSVVLERFHKTSKKLQSTSMDLHEAVRLLNSLKEYVASLRESFDEFEEKGMSVTNNNEYKESTQRKRSRSSRLTHHDGPADAANLSPRMRFKVEVFIPVLDRLDSELKRRLDAYTVLCSKFGFLHDLLDIDTSELREKAKQLQESYPDDLEATFPEEVIHFREYIKSSSLKILGDISIELYLYRTLTEHSLQDVFPNLGNALRMYLCLMVSNCSGERSFSALKRIKNVLRSKMLDEKLNHLSIMSIESGLLRKLDFSDIISEFVKRKARKMFY